jgi:hypothetical protein
MPGWSQTTSLQESSNTRRVLHVRVERCQRQDLHRRTHLRRVRRQRWHLGGSGRRQGLAIPPCAQFDDGIPNQLGTIDNAIGSNLRNLLIGDAGADVFVFQRTDTGEDRVADVQAADQTITLSNAWSSGGMNLDLLTLRDERVVLA